MKRTDIFLNNFKQKKMTEEKIVTFQQESIAIYQFI